MSPALKARGSKAQGGGCEAAKPWVGAESKSSPERATQKNGQEYNEIYLWILQICIALAGLNVVYP
jgi:hypothetical protein